MPGSIHPEMTNEALGMRMHEVNRQRAVERAVERLRHGLKADWHYLSQDDITNLRWLFGELWATLTHAEWDEMHFSKVSFEATRRLVSIADRLRRHGTRRVASLEDAHALVTLGVPHVELAGAGLEAAAATV